MKRLYINISFIEVHVNLQKSQLEEKNVGQEKYI